MHLAYRGRARGVRYGVHTKARSSIVHSRPDSWWPSAVLLNVMKNSEPSRGCVIVPSQEKAKREDVGPVGLEGLEDDESLFELVGQDYGMVSRLYLPLAVRSLPLRMSNPFRSPPPLLCTHEHLLSASCFPTRIPTPGVLRLTGD